MTAFRNLLVWVARPEVFQERLVALGRPLTVGVGARRTTPEDTVKQGLAVPPKARGLILSPARGTVASRLALAGRGSLC
jgi:hypothetical protein